MAIHKRLAVDGVARQHEAAGGAVRREAGSEAGLRQRLPEGPEQRSGLLRSPDTKHGQQDDEQQGEQQVLHERL